MKSDPKELEAADKSSPDTGYVRPDAKQRFRNYLNNLASPVSLAYYGGTAGLLTLRNSPREWGDKADGFGRRFANVVGKNAIRSTTIYALDEALELDSAYYPSRDRSTLGRLRNCVFSAVTARNKKGKRVIGIPVIAGGVLSEVVSSSGWYPKRYDYVHGLKGGAISIGIATGVNLFKEFVWNPQAGVARGQRFWRENCDHYLERSSERRRMNEIRTLDDLDSADRCRFC
ncbi:MAG: hypothetical protein AB7F88_05155 [Pyrinomonadaceae bacterium]